MNEITGDEEDNAKRRPQKTNSRKGRSIHFEEENLRSRSLSRRRTRSGRGSSFGKNKRSIMPKRSHSYSSDDSSGMSSDIEAVVAAAALAVSTHADGSSSSNSSTENSPLHTQKSWTPLPGIGEEPSRSRRHFDQDVNNPVDSNSRALVPSSSMERKPKDDMALVPVPSRKSSRRDLESGSGGWDKQIVPSGSGASDNREGAGRRSRNSSMAKESRKDSEIIDEESKEGKNKAKAVAWLEAETAKIDQRFGMKANAIHAKENERINEADMIFKEIERKLNVQRMKAYEKMKSDIDRIKKKADREREKMNSKKDAEIDKVFRRAKKIRRSGRAPFMSCSCC